MNNNIDDTNESPNKFFRPKALKTRCEFKGFKYHNAWPKSIIRSASNEMLQKPVEKGGLWGAPGAAKELERRKKKHAKKNAA